MQKITDFSPYRVQIENRTYVFSDAVYEQKFRQKLQDYIDDLSFRMSNKYKMAINYYILAEVLCYLKTQPDGCRIIVYNDNNKEVISCRDEILVESKTIRMKPSVKQ